MSPPRTNAAGDTAILNVIPTTGPNDKETEDLVKSIRNSAGEIKAVSGAEVPHFSD